MQWASMTYEVTKMEMLVRYKFCHDPDSEIIFRVMVQPIEAEVRLSAIQEEHLDSIYTTFCIFYTTSTDVQVILSWV